VFWLNKEEVELYIDSRGKRKSNWSDGPTRGRGSSKQFPTGNYFYTNEGSRKQPTGVMVRWMPKRNYFALQYVSFVISGDQLINVKYITIFLL
jgi:hypothetical protein